MLKCPYCKKLLDLEEAKRHECMELAAKSPDECRVCKSFAENFCITPKEASIDCYIHSVVGGTE